MHYARVPMHDDKQTAATKQDVQLLMQEIGKLYDANQRWKQEVMQNTDDRISASEERVMGHFDLVAENIKYDFQGAFNDKLVQHERRIIRLERKAGLSVAR